MVIGDWLDPEDERVPQHEAESSTLADFVGRLETASATSADPHETGTQRGGLCHLDTGDIFGYPQEFAHKHKYKAEGTLSSKFASPYSTPMEDIDLNLPEPKPDQSVATNSSGTDESALSPHPSSTLEGNKGAEPLSPNIPSTPAKLTPTSNALSPARTGQRPKKRTVWRGRNCVIALPLDESRGKAGGAPLPLTREEIQDRLRSWESEGFDTSNFKLASAGESQSRRAYPSSEDERAERKQGRYSVNIPDRGKWEAYVEQLKEQKLRALGVSFGHEDPKASVSVGPMSRQASSQYAISPISPALPIWTMTNQSIQSSPILTTITSSQHSRVESLASPGFRLSGAPRAGPSVPPLASPFQHPLQHQVAPAQPLLSPPPTLKDGQLAVACSLSTRPAHVQQTHVLHQPQPRAVLAHRLYGDNVFGPAEKRDVSNSSTLSSSSWTDSKPASTDTVLVSSFGKPPEEAAKNITSKLNVEAKEFSFGGTSSTLPRNFSFNSGPNIQTSKHSPSRPSPFSRASSATHGATHRSLNVAAEPFQPSSTLGASAGSFDFPSAGPTLKQGASRSFYKKSTAEESISRSSSTGFKGRVFSAGNVAKPPKKSKAIPIVRPDEGADGSSDGVDDGVEDESGRITQGIGRQKRLRRGGDDGDDVPQFAIPNEPPTMPGAEPTVEPIGTDEETTPSDKENITPDNEGLKATGPRSARLQPVSSQLGPSRSKPQSKGSREWDPFQFRSQVEAEQFNAALPRPSSATSQKVSVYEDDDAAEDPQSLSAQEAEIAVAADLELAETDLELPIPPSSAGKHSKMSSLSETENSLRYRPSDAISFSSSVGAPMTHDFRGCKPINSSGSYPDPTSSSPRALIESPATTLRPSEVGSFRADIPQPRKHSPYYKSDSAEYDALAQASVEEIDAVMERLNGEDSDLGVERAERIWGHISPKRAPIPSFDEPTPAPQLLPSNVIRSDAPSPSPSRVKPVYRAQPGDREVLGDPVFSAESLDAVKVGMPNRTPIHRLNKADDVPASDWDDVLSPAEEAKLEPRTHFFDNRVNDLVGGLLQQRLGPLEKALLEIQASLSGLATKSRSRYDRRSFSPDVVDSDADDEDESDHMCRPRTGSPKRDRRLEQIKAVVAEAFSAKRQVPRPSESVGDDVRRDKDSLSPSTSTVDDDARARKEVENRLRELEEKLQAAEGEKASLREIAEAKHGERREYDDKHHQTLVQAQMRTAMLEGAQESLQQTVTELQEKNSALEGTLAEYRLSSNDWREEIVKTHEENRALSGTVESLKLQMEESMRVREGLRGKFDRLQESMASAARDIARDQEAWAKKEGDHKVELEVAAAKLATEEMARAQLWREVERLRLEEKEAIRLGVVVEETSKAKKELQAMVESLRQESLGHQQSSARLENEVQQSKDVRSSEIQAIKASMSADIEAAHHELKMVRADLESQLARARQQVENAYSDAADAKVTSTSLLQEAMDAQRATIEDLRKDTEDLVRDRETRHRTQLEEIHSQHDRALHNAKEGKERTESHLLERLSLSDSKCAHLQDRVTHLEERLEIAKSAAHAAAQAAQSAKGSSSTGMSTRTASISAPTQALPSSIEKISPQALRESILVLQEQLQERERTIESLESEMTTFDPSLPAKIKERDSEVAWLRELLSVRVADLQDIITTISSDQIDFDRDAVKDAAIRLKAGLEMELQERERTTS
ncbi:MAG: hypothetical protein M1835_000711, partial [Candelina submexicana]